MPPEASARVSVRSRLVAIIVVLVVAIPLFPRFPVVGMLAGLCVIAAAPRTRQPGHDHRPRGSKARD